MEDTRTRVLVFFLLIALFALAPAVPVLIRITHELQRERQIGEGKAYVLKIPATVEFEAADGFSDKCVLARGDCVRIDLIEDVAGGDSAVTVSYAPVAPPADDNRCVAGTSVIFTKTNVEQLVGAQ